MRKRFIVRLSDEKRGQLIGIVKKFKGSSEKVRRARILLKADADGPAWGDPQIADAFGCRRQTVENVRQSLVERGLEQTLNGLKREHPPTPKLLDGGQEVKVRPRSGQGHRHRHPSGLTAGRPCPLDAAAAGQHQR